jgi:uncharacterized protein YbjT (DUF2867 family)
LVGRSVAEQNAVFLPWGDGTTVIPLVSAEDVSRVAATLLAQRSQPSDSVYALITETPTVNEIVDRLESALGRRIRYVQVSDEQWADAVQGWVNPHALDHLSHLWQYFRKGEDKFQATDAIRLITSSNPLTLDLFFRANAEAMGGTHNDGQASKAPAA